MRRAKTGFERKMQMFVEQVEEQLRQMSEAEKDSWILSQAKLLEEREQQGFLLSLSGKKKITYMPDDSEIEEFCRKVEKGEIYLEYENHYYEFDDDGRYMDEWVVWHNDPFAAMEFLDRVFKGCHDLMILNEYKAAADILDRVCRLRFQIIESPNSDSFESEPSFTMEDIVRENMLSVNSSDIGEDWVTAFIRQKPEWDAAELAGAMADIFQEPVCKTINPSILAGEKLPARFFLHMKNILSEELHRTQDMFALECSGEDRSREEKALEKKAERIKHLVSDIESKCMSTYGLKES